MRIYAALAVLILALSTGLWYSVSKLFTARSELTSTKVALDKQIKATEALQALIGSIQTNTQKVQVKSTESRQEINHALKENQEWANAAVPSDVGAVLCKSTRCYQTKPVPSSSH